VKATAALQTRTGRLIGSVSDSGEFLYGALISASVMAAVNTAGGHASFVALSALLVLGVYWLAHVYIAAQADPADQTGSEISRVGERLRAAAGHEASILKGGLPAVAVYAIALTSGMSTSDAATTAVLLSVLLLTAAGWITARRSGLHGRAALVDALAAGALGLVVIAAKTLLH
jgi:hypothetical protein